MQVAHEARPNSGSCAMPRPAAHREECMRRTKLVALATASLIGAAITLPLTSIEAGAQPGSSPQVASSAAKDTNVSDSFTPAWQQKYQKRNEAALEKRLRHGGKGDSVKLGRHKYGRVAQTGTDRIFVVLAEFGNARHTSYCDSTDATACPFPSDGTPQRYDGPLHNQIPKPDRTKDNSTLWQKDYNRSHYENMYFSRMKSFYSQQSSGKYTVDGDVTEWVKVPFNEARYGRDYCHSIVCGSTYNLIRDALAEWTQSKLDAGWTMSHIQSYLKTFDHQDRYDYDGDGNFNEPDGYIDHFQIVHAG